jgi:SOS-response transcriptional repressor LexA
VDVLKSDGPEIWEVFNLPIMGMANCGPAMMVAEQKVEGYIQVSPKIIGRKNSEGLFAIRAVGNSLNKAEKVKGGPIKDGDYVIVDSTKRDPDNGEYVLSVIGGVANLKRFYKDSKSKIIKLMSESTAKIPPICIHFDDFEDYMVNGVVLMSIRG